MNQIEPTGPKKQRYPAAKKPTITRKYQDLCNVVDLLISAVQEMREIQEDFWSEKVVSKYTDKELAASEEKVDAMVIGFLKYKPRL